MTAPAPADRWSTLGQIGVTIWLTGLPASGKSAIAAALEARLVGAGRAAYLIDGDNLRHGLSADLGFDAVETPLEVCEERDPKGSTAAHAPARCPG